MHEIERRSPLYRVTKGVLVEAKFIAKCSDESTDIGLTDGDDQIDDQCGSGNAVERACQRAADQVRKSDVLSHCGQVQCDVDAPARTFSENSTSRVPTSARRLSRRTMSNIKPHLFLAFPCNSAGVPIAAGVLYPFFGLLLSPVIAAAAMSFSSVSVIGNSPWLRRAEL